MSAARSSTSVPTMPTVVLACATEDAVAMTKVLRRLVERGVRVDVCAGVELDVRPFEDAVARATGNTIYVLCRSEDLDAFQVDRLRTAARNARITSDRLVLVPFDPELPIDFAETLLRHLAQIGSVRRRVTRELPPVPIVGAPRSAAAELRIDGEAANVVARALAPSTKPAGATPISARPSPSAAAPSASAPSAAAPSASPSVGRTPISQRGVGGPGLSPPSIDRGPGVPSAIAIDESFFKLLDTPPKPAAAPALVVTDAPVVASKPMVTAKLVAARPPVAVSKPVAAKPIVAATPVVAPKRVVAVTPVAPAKRVVAVTPVAPPKRVVAMTPVAAPKPSIAAKRTAAPTPVAAPRAVVAAKPVARPTRTVPKTATISVPFVAPKPARVVAFATKVPEPETDEELEDEVTQVMPRRATLAMPLPMPPPRAVAAVSAPIPPTAMTVDTPAIATLETPASETVETPVLATVETPAATLETPAVPLARLALVRVPVGAPIAPATVDTAVTLADLHAPRPMPTPWAAFPPATTPTQEPSTASLTLAAALGEAFPLRHVSAKRAGIALAIAASAIATIVGIGAASGPSAIDPFTDAITPIAVMRGAATTPSIDPATRPVAAPGPVLTAIEDRTIRALDGVFVSVTKAPTLRRKAATLHCRNLVVAGLRDWRLPTSEEIAQLGDAGFIASDSIWWRAAGKKVRTPRVEWNGNRVRAQRAGKKSVARVLCVHGVGK